MVTFYYLIIAACFLAALCFCGEFGRDEGESLKKYARKCAGNVAWALAWPLMAVTAVVFLVCRFD